MARVTANAQGNAPTGTKVGDIVSTKGGDYKVVEKGTPGASYNPSSGLYSVKVDSPTPTTGTGSQGTTTASRSGTIAKPTWSGSSSGQTSYLDDDGNKKQGLYTSDPLRYSDIQTMKNLASAWHSASDENKKALANQSYVIGSALGATRDKDGVWWYNGQKLFETQYTPKETPNAYDGYMEKLDSYQQNQADLLNQQYAAALAAARENLDSQKQQVNQQYDDLARQLYIQRRMNERDLPDQMAAMGYTGGITESSALGLQTSYADALRQGETQRINTIASLEQAIRQAEMEGNQALAAQLSSLAQNTMGLYADALSQIQSQANTDRQFQYQQLQDALTQRNWNQQFVYNQEQDKLDRETAQKEFQWQQEQAAAQQQAQKESELNSLALQLMQYGIVPDTATLVKMGYTQQQAQQLAQRMWLIQQGYYG